MLLAADRLNQAMGRLTGTQSAAVLAALLGLASLTIVTAALASQYLGGLQPCVLCIYQRWPYAVAVLLAGVCVAVFARSRDRDPRLAMLLLAGIGIAMIVGAGLGFFHVGVEQHWWAGTSACGAAPGSADSIEALKQQLLATPVVRCDEVAWSLGGISMAGFNMAISIWLAIAAFAGTDMVRRLVQLERSA